MSDLDRIRPPRKSGSDPVLALFHPPARFVAGWIVDEHTRLGQGTTVAVGYFVLAAVVAVFLWVLIMWIYSSERDHRRALPQRLQHHHRAKVMPELLNLPTSETSLMCLGLLAVLVVAVVVFTRGRLAYQGRPAGSAGVAAQPSVR